MAYGTNAGLTAYATSTGRTVTGDPDVLRYVASQYINSALFWDRWIGNADDPYSGEAWPRDVLAGVPVLVENATYEAALLYDADHNALSSGSVSNNGSGAIAQEKVDTISVSYHAPMSDDSMAESAVIDNAPRYSVIEGILAPLLRKQWGSSVAAFVV